MNETQDRLPKRTGEEGNKIVKRFNNWAMERMDAFPPKLFEAKARFQITMSAEEDLNTGGQIDSQNYARQFSKIAKLLNEKGFSEESVLKSEEKQDSITGEPFITRIRKEGEYFVAEEIGNEGKIITQAKISESGSTQLTLKFRDERYSPDENPGISKDSGFPRATLSTFELLVNTFR